MLTRTLTETAETLSGAEKVLAEAAAHKFAEIALTMRAEEVSFRDVSSEAILESLAARHDGVGTVLNLLGRNLHLAAEKCDAWFTREYPSSTLIRGAASGAAAVVGDMLPETLTRNVSSAMHGVHDYGKAYAGEGGAYLGGIAAGVAAAEVGGSAARFTGELAAGAKVAIKADGVAIAEVASAAEFNHPDIHHHFDFPITESLEVSGKSATRIAPAYERRVVELYKDFPEGVSKYETELGSFGIADHVAVINNRRIAIEVKYVDDWTKSPNNPISQEGQFPFLQGIREKLLEQAQKYENSSFAEVLYHTNSKEFAEYYSKQFAEHGIKKIRVYVTPVIKRK